MASKTDHFSSPDDARRRAQAALSPRPMQLPNRRWDHFLAVLRRVLPAAALLLAGGAIIWPFLSDTVVSFTLSKQEVDASGDGKVTLKGLRYEGTDVDDRLFVIRAERGEQEDPGTPRIRLEAMQAEMDLRPDLPVRLSARTGLYRIEDKQLSLIGGVTVRSGDGFTLGMNGAEVDLAAREAVGSGAVSGQAEIGELLADRVRLQLDGERGIFEGNVTVRITPKRPESGASPKASP